MERQTIVVWNMDKFAFEIAKLNRRAEKLGVPVVTYTVGREIAAVEQNELLENVTVAIGNEVELSYEIVRLTGDWRLIGVIDHTENLTKTVPGETMPAEFLGADSVCDYCRTRRVRNETFVVMADDGETAQIGRDCLGDFLGIDAARALGQARFSAQLGELDGEEFVGRRERRGWTLETFMAYVIHEIRTNGFCSRQNAGPDRSATADRVQGILSARPNMRPVVTDAHRAEAAATIEWLLAIDVNSANDYMRNLWQIGQNGFVTAKSAGYAASAFGAYQRALESAIERLNAGPKSHVGTVGGKLAATLNLIKTSSFDSQYGVTHVHSFRDSAGNVIIWKTGTELEPGREYSLTATVKAHEEFRGTPQTVITRAKIA